jgi:hypothetical protein
MGFDFHGNTVEHGVDAETIVGFIVNVGFNG